MSLRFIAGLATARRAAVGTALAATLSLATIAAADQQVTALLRNGERVTGLFDGYNNNQVYVDVSASDERKIPVGDVALLDFVGGAQGLPETELSQARGDDHVLLLKSGNAAQGRLVSVEGTDRDPTLLFKTTSGEERRVRFSEVGRLYLGRYPGAAPATAAPSVVTTSPATTAGQTGSIAVNANQQWTSSGISVAKGQLVRFTSSGEVQLSTDANDTATTAGSKIGRRLTAGPLPGQLAGALIGRIGNGQAFGIGNQTEPLSMPGAGVLFLAVNDDNVGDNQGAFAVTVTAQPTTVTTGSRPGQIRRP